MTSPPIDVLLVSLHQKKSELHDVITSNQSKNKKVYLSGNQNKPHQIFNLSPKPLKTS